VQNGNMGDVRNVGENVSELKLDLGPGYRIYFALAGQVIIVLLGGGDKSTQDKDIKTAKRLWRENRDATERFQRDFGA
jgi:putative addiction module killer protein